MPRLKMQRLVLGRAVVAVAASSNGGGARLCTGVRLRLASEQTKRYYGFLGTLGAHGCNRFEQRNSGAWSSSAMAAAGARSSWNDDYGTNAPARAEGKDGKAHNTSYGVGFEVGEAM